MSAKTIKLEEWEAEQMQEPEFRAAAEELEPSYQVTRLRILRGLTQEQLAQLVGTKQSSIARLESGKAEPRLSFLRRVVEALGGRLEVRIVSPEGAPVAERSIPVTVQQRPYPVEVHWIDNQRPPKCDYFVWNSYALNTTPNLERAH